MKKLSFIISLVLLSFLTLSSKSQVHLNYSADTTEFKSLGVNGNNLIIRNSTKAISGYLYNIGNGVTQFRVPTEFWKTTGNSGTDTIINFIGTTDVKPLLFKINSVISGYIGTEVSGGGNTSYGLKTFFANTTGTSLTAFGYHALQSNTTGSWNTAMGVQSMDQTNTGQENSGYGFSALRLNTGGSWNTGIGNEALRNNTTGTYNTALGFKANRGSLTGIENVAIGAYSMHNTTNGFNNTAVGNHSLFSGTTAQYNVAVGDSALFGTTTGNHNIGLGYKAGIANVTGSNKLYISDSLNTMYFKNLDSAATQPFNQVGRDINGDWHMYKTIKISTGTSAPATTPQNIGDLFVDTSAGKLYFAKGTASSADWIIVN